MREDFDYTRCHAISKLASIMWKLPGTLLLQVLGKSAVKAAITSKKKRHMSILPKFMFSSSSNMSLHSTIPLHLGHMRSSYFLPLSVWH